MFDTLPSRIKIVTAANHAAEHQRALERISIYLKENGVPPDAVYPEDVLRAWQADGIGLLSFNQFCKMDGITGERENFHTFMRFHSKIWNVLSNQMESASVDDWRFYLRAFREQRDFADEKATQHDALR